jgi:methyl-accepting chemotaxis protein WspA
LDAILYSQRAPDLLSATRDLRDFLVGPLRNYHYRLFDDLSDATNRMALFNSRRAAMRETLDGLYTRFSTQVVLARDGEIGAARTIVLSSLLIFPAFLIALLLLNGHAAPGANQPVGALAAALTRLRHGDFTQRLSWDRSDELGDAAREIDSFCDQMAQALPQARKTADMAGDFSVKVAKAEQERDQAFAHLAAHASNLEAVSGRFHTTAGGMTGQAAKVQTAVQSVSELAISSTTAAGKCESSLRNLATAANLTTAKLAAANEKANALSPLISTISKVADEASLLSLNAAIEAEKAGEYGLGFTVVAMEIRRFSEQAAMAAKELEKLAHDLQATAGGGAIDLAKASEEAKAAAALAGETSRHLASVVQQAQSLSPLCASLFGNALDHSSGAQRMAEDLAKLAQDVRAAALPGHLQEARLALEGAVRSLKSSLDGWTKK